VNFLDGDESTGFLHETFSNQDLQRIRAEMILEHRQLMRSRRAAVARKLQRGLWYLMHPQGRPLAARLGFSTLHPESVDVDTSRLGATPSVGRRGPTLSPHEDPGRQ
jgi:hypothetical protein